MTRTMLLGVESGQQTLDHRHGAVRGEHQHRVVLLPPQAVHEARHLPRVPQTSRQQLLGSRDRHRRQAFLYSLASVLDVGDRCVCEALIIGSGERLGDVYAVEEVMPCYVLFFEGRLGSADVHLPVDLALGIDGDNLGVEALRELNGYLCFADCCRTEEVRGVLLPFIERYDFHPENRIQPILETRV